jgi:hypothetical protein
MLSLPYSVATKILINLSRSALQREERRHLDIVRICGETLGKDRSVHLANWSLVEQRRTRGIDRLRQLGDNTSAFLKNQLEPFRWTIEVITASENSK